MAKQTKSKSKPLPLRSDEATCNPADIAALKSRLDALEAMLAAVTTAPSGSLFFAEDGVLNVLTPPAGGTRRLVWDNGQWTFIPE